MLLVRRAGAAQALLSLCGHADMLREELGHTPILSYYAKPRRHAIFCRHAIIYLFASAIFSRGATRHIYAASFAMLLPPR